MYRNIVYFSNFLKILQKIPTQEINGILDDWYSSFSDKWFYETKNLIQLIEFIAFEWKAKLISESFGTRALSNFLNALIRKEKIENFLSLSYSLPQLLLDINNSSYRDINNIWGLVEDNSGESILRIIYYLLGLKNTTIYSSDVLDLFTTSRPTFPLCDIIITQALLKRRISNFRLREINHIISKDFPFEVKDITGIYLAFTLLKLNPEGRAFIVIPESFLFAEKSKEIRSFLIDYGLIEAVFSLPYGVFTQTASKTSLLIIRSPEILRKNNKSIFFGRIRTDKKKDIPHYIDEILSSFYNNKELEDISRIVPYEEIKDNNNRLSAEQYVYHNYSELFNLDETYIPLQRLIKKKVQGNLSRTNLNEPSPLVLTKDLYSDSSGEYFLDVTKLKTTSTGSRNTTIEKSAILISLVGSELKPTLYKHIQGAAPLVLHSNVLALIPNDNVDIEYLLFQLKSELTKTQCFRIRYGRTAHKISVSDFMKVKIRILSLEEQEIRAKEFKTLLFQQKKAEFQKFEKRLQIESLETEYNVVATIAHNLNQKLNTVESNFRMIKYVLERFEKQGVIDLSLPVNPNAQISLNGVVSKLGDGIQNMSNTLMTVRRVLQKKKLNTQEVRPEKLKHMLFSHITPIGYDLEIIFDRIFLKKSENLTVVIDIDAFKEIINNFISNALRHGFVDKTCSHYQIVFDFSLATDDNNNFWLKIEYKNNGRPFPKGFSFEEYKRFGGRAGETKNSGLGGFWINKVVELHGGEFNFLNSEKIENEEYNVKFEILLPIKNIK